MKKTAWAFVDYAAHCHDDNDFKKVEVGYLEIKSGVDHQIAHARVAFQYLLQAIDTTFCHCEYFWSKHVVSASYNENTGIIKIRTK